MSALTVRYELTDTYAPYRYNPHYACKHTMSRTVPRSGELMFQIIPPPNEFMMSLTTMFDGIFSLHEICGLMATEKDVIHRSEMYKIYDPMVQDPLSFCYNVRPFGVSAVSPLQEYELTLETSYIPIMIYGKAETGTSYKTCDTFRLPANMVQLEDADSYYPVIDRANFHVPILFIHLTFDGNNQLQFIVNTKPMYINREMYNRLQYSLVCTLGFVDLRNHSSHITSRFVTHPDPTYRAKTKYFFFEDFVIPAPPMWRITTHNNKIAINPLLKRCPNEETYFTNIMNKKITESPLLKGLYNVLNE